MSETFGQNRPADRALAMFLRENHQFGSRDRQVISESIFAVFRWWGALRQLINPAILNALELPGESAVTAWQNLQDKLITALLLGANLLESRETEVSTLWERELQFKRPAGINSETELSQRINAVTAALSKALGLAQVVNVSAKDLLPEWIVPLLPEQAENFTRWCQRRPPMWLRGQGAHLNELEKRLTTQGLTVTRHQSVQNAFCAGNAKVNLYSLPEFRDGWFEVQDMASQLIGLTCAPKPGQRWWDACAGAGGKTLQLAEIMQRRGSVIASDIREYKLEDLRKRAKRAGFPNIVCKEWDGKALRKKQQENFDGVLVDAPCSCSGTWRRNPDARWTTRPEEIDEMAELQLKILSNAATGVKPGGILVYATCSIFSRENRVVVENFLATNPQFALEPFTNPLNAGLTDGMLQVFPWDADCDAMFAARMRRTTDILDKVDTAPIGQ